MLQQCRITLKCFKVSKRLLSVSVIILLQMVNSLLTSVGPQTMASLALS